MEEKKMNGDMKNPPEGSQGKLFEPAEFMNRPVEHSVGSQKPTILRRRGRPPKSATATIVETPVINPQDVHKTLVTANKEWNHEKDDWAQINNRIFVSTHGRVKAIRVDGRSFYLGPKIATDGRAYVPFRENKKTVKMDIAVLVASAFIPNPDKKPHVIFKDNNPANGVAWNLDWGYAPPAVIPGKKIGYRQPIIKKSIGGEFLSVYQSISEAAKDNSILKLSLYNALNNKKEAVVCGYLWEAIDDNVLHNIQSAWNDAIKKIVTKSK